MLAAEAQVTLATEMVERARQAQEAAEEKFRAGDVSLIEVNTARVEAGRAHRERLSAAQKRELALGGEAIPNPRVGVGYGREEDAHILQATLGLPLPVFNRNQAERGASRARVLQAQASLEALERRVSQEVQLAAARYKAARDTLDVFAGGVLQAARENMELATEGYRAGQLDFFQFLLIRRETLEARRGHIEALEELNAAEARLERALGASPLLASGQGRNP